MAVEKRRKFLINFFYFVVIAALLIAAVRYALPALIPFFVAMIVSILLKPLIRFFHDRLHVAKNIASVILTLLFYATVGVLAVLLVWQLVETVADLISALPDFYKNTLEPLLWRGVGRVETLVQNVTENPDFSLAAAATDAIGALGSTVTNFSVKVIGFAGQTAVSVPVFLLDVLIAVVSTVFWSMDFDLINLFLLKQFSEENQALIRNIVTHLGKVIREYIVSYLIIFAVTFVENCIGLLILGVDHAVLIALLIALFDLLPVVGSGTILVPWAIIDLFTGRIPLGIGLIVLFLVIVIVRYIIEPKVVGERVGLHPLLTLVAMIAGTYIFGGIGILLMPLLLALAQSLNTAGVLKLYKPLEKSDGETSDAEMTRAVTKQWDRVVSKFKKKK